LGGLLECCDELFSASDDSSCLVSLAERLVGCLRVFDFGFDFFLSASFCSKSNQWELAISTPSS